MHDAMFIVHSLEQSPVYWNFVLYKSWCVVQYFSPLLFQMKVIALLQQIINVHGYLKHYKIRGSAL